MLVPMMREFEDTPFLGAQTLPQWIRKQDLRSNNHNNVAETHSPFGHQGQSFRPVNFAISQLLS